MLGHDQQVCLALSIALYGIRFLKRVSSAVNAPHAEHHQTIEARLGTVVSISCVVEVFEEHSNPSVSFNRRKARAARLYRDKSRGDNYTFLWEADRAGRLVLTLERQSDFIGRWHRLQIEQVFIQLENGRTQELEFVAERDFRERLQIVAALFAFDFGPVMIGFPSTSDISLPRESFPMHIQIKGAVHDEHKWDPVTFNHTIYVKIRRTEPTREAILRKMTSSWSSLPPEVRIAGSYAIKAIRFVTGVVPGVVVSGLLSAISALAEIVSIKSVSIAGK